MKEILKAFKQRIINKARDKRIRELRHSLLQYEHLIKVNELNINIAHEQLAELGYDTTIPIEWKLRREAN